MTRHGTVRYVVRNGLHYGMSDRRLAETAMKATGSIIVRFSLLVFLAVVWSCNPRPAQVPLALPPTLSVPPRPARAPLVTDNPQPVATAVDCGLFPGQAQTSQSISTVGLSESIDPVHAPRPSNESERLLFRQLYETLIRADCQGHAAPGLAESWRLDDVRNAVIVTLRPNARFSDNTPVTAADVASSWMSVGVGRGNERELRPEVRRLVRSIVAIDDRTLEITLQRGRRDAILALAHTDLAIARSVPGSPWPLGTRAAKVDPGGALPMINGSSVVTLIRLSANSSTPATPEFLSSIRFLVAPGRDGRDLLDQGVDLFLTRDPRTLGYAATLPQFVTTPLPWQRTHVLLVPGQGRTTSSPFSLSVEERRTLAQDAIRGEARGSEGPFWWESLPDCELPASQPAVPATSRSGRIVYDTSDAAARELAERFVGIGTFPRTNGLSGDALVQALRRGNESAYIISVDRRPLDPCREMQVLVNSGGWIDLQSIVPLIDTRLHAIVRRGRSGVSAEWDGALVMDGIGTIGK